MKDNKKKTIVVIALAVVVLAIGAFQFTSGGAPAPAPKADAKAQPETSTPAVATDAAKTDAPKNPLFASNLAPRDPFHSEDLAPAPAQPNSQVAPPKEQPKPMRLPRGDIDTSGRFAGMAPVTIQAIPEQQFGFSLGGVMLGSKPMAVFKDGQGNQRLVMLGGSLDPDSKVVSIDKDAVTVRFHGKAIKLTVEGNPNAK